MKKIISLILCIAAILLCTVSCGDEKAEDTTAAAGEVSSKEPVYVEMSVKEHGIIKLELYPDIAPVTVENFVSLVKEGFYDGLTFHRISKGFMIQGGGPDNGRGGSGKEIFGEFRANGFDNPLSHDRGVISMARTNDPNSASSQFFICDSGNYKSSLDGRYAAFGKVIEGIEVVDSIASVDVVMNSQGSERSVPVHPVVIEYVKVIEK